MTKNTVPTRGRRLKRNGKLAEKAFQRLSKAILSGELKEGDSLKETRLAHEWKIGITPLREAIRRAAEFGYLILRPNRTTLVRKLSTDDISHIYAMRELLECAALDSASDRFTDTDFRDLETLVRKAEKTSSAPQRIRLQYSLDIALHHLWVQRCENPWLTSTLQRLLVFLPNYNPNANNLFKNRNHLAEAAFREHKLILQALRKKDLRVAKQLLASHIRAHGALLVKLHEEGPLGDKKVPVKRVSLKKAR
ncbi:MAG: GntR family transcriptional regulator [Chthoniobacterales bacterium]